MKLTSVCALVIVCTVYVQLSSADLVPPVTIARCRVNCLQVTLKRNRINDDICFVKNSCKMCWDVCGLLFQKYEIFSPICGNTKQCHKGCKTACKFRDSVPKVPLNAGVEWSFGLKPFSHVYKSTQRIQIFWERPEPKIPQIGRIPFLYILFVKNAKLANSQWEEVKQTASTTVNLSLDNLPSFPKFWLLAVNKNGTRVSAFIDNDFDPIKQVFRSTDVNDEHRAYSSKLNTSVQIEKNSTAGTISALIEWKHPAHVVGRQITYEINYFLENCGIYRDSPPCDIPDEHYGHTVTVATNKQPSFRIKDILYNSHYKVIVEFSDLQDELIFKTPSCVDVDENTYRVCPGVMTTTKNPKQPDTSTQGYPSDDNSTYLKEKEESLRWNISIGEPLYIKTANRVSVTLNWSTPYNQSAIQYYQLTYNQEDMSEGSDSQIVATNTTRMTLQLKPYRTYIIVVEAYFGTSSGFSGTRSSEEIRFNTSGIAAMPMIGESKSRIIHKGKNWKNLNDIIVAATCIATVIMVGLIILFIYKKRQSFKDIIITKTAVAKSNSYKSNVGCKVDYSNQLLMMSDEWELDPCLLKFSSPIGQGAFGKVVTGYYKDSRVAIKLVRDSAPLSYKEDLLAEINLMKRIGSHPNIVSMTGACTLSEPIALIMEYVPYGNLQNFLKKCRLEGDFQKRVGRPSEVMYSIMDEHGGLDSGVITPADMLSFARQIAMAMEYLSAKKYVHRDLAARNVLLDHDKVVKVCDFGLSRDIYNENQYHKVTSGKLPLKWMAIESLRDRVFTTQSDVWSFGILFWEIVTMGGSPYTNIALADLYYVLANGYRMEKPSNCSNELYAIMRQCWMENPSDRPNFTDIRLQIEQLLSRDRNYLELDNIDVPLSTSESSSLPKSENETMTFFRDRPPSQNPSKTVTISLPPQGPNNANVCIEQSTEWLIRGRDDETTS